MYLRVIPRDLFNESKLLKSLGQVALLIHDGQAPDGLGFIHSNENYPGFNVGQDQSTGDLSVTNLRLCYRSTEIGVSSRYNSRSPYPLSCTDEAADYCDILDDNGRFASGFLEYLGRCS